MGDRHVQPGPGPRHRPHRDRRDLPRRDRGALRRPARERPGRPGRPPVPGHQPARRHDRRPGGAEGGVARPARRGRGLRPRRRTRPHRHRPLPHLAGTARRTPPRARRSARAAGARPVTDPSGAAVLLEHPDGPLVLRIDLDEQRPFTGEDQLLLSLLAGRLAQGLARAHQIDQQRETAIALQRAILGPSHLPDGRRPLRARHPALGGRRRLVRHRHPARRPHRDRRRRLRRPRPGGRQRHGPVAQRLPRPAAAGRRPGPGAHGPGPVRRRRSRRGLHHRLLRGPRRRDRRTHVLQRRAPPGILVRPDGTTRLLEDGRSLPWPSAPAPGAPRAAAPSPPAPPCCCTPTDSSNAAVGRSARASTRRAKRSRTAGTPRSTTSPPTSCPGWPPPTATTTTSPCCSTATRPR